MGLRTWILAARPKTLFASICPVAIGGAMAARDGQFHLFAMSAALVGALSIQIGTNFCNDYFDFRQGADTAERQGPTRAVQAGLVSPAAMLTATLIAFSITAIICVYLVNRAGWPLAVVGAISVFCGFWYTATRFSLAYLGLGDIFVLVFFGPVAVAGTYYVQAITLQPSAVIAGIAPGLLSVAILVVNNLRDIEQDAKAEKRTLAVRLGKRFAQWEYAACIFLSGLVPFVLWSSFDWHASILWAAVAVTPGLVLARQISHCVGPTLNPMLGKTAGVLLLYTVTFSIVCLIP